jgi:hypothetical protein
VLGGGDVVEEDGLAGEGDLADDALAEGNAVALGLRGVADLEPHAEVVGAVIEQEDGEDAVLDDGTDELRGAVEEGLQVECGVEGVGKLGEVGEVGGLDADVYGVKMGQGIVGVGGAIVSFELMRVGRRWGNFGHGVSRE